MTWISFLKWIYSVSVFCPFFTILLLHGKVCAFYPQFNKSISALSRVENGPTGSGPNPDRTRKYKPESGSNPKINLKPKSCPKKSESKVRSEKFSNIANLFLLFFVHVRQKIRLRPELSPTFLSTFGPTWPEPEPDPKSLARLTTPPLSKLLHTGKNFVQKFCVWTIRAIF